MDFDRIGNGASTPVVMRGRGFTEKPVAQPVVVQSQKPVRSFNKKVTPNTEFVVNQTRNQRTQVFSSGMDQRRMNNGRRNVPTYQNQGMGRRYNDNQEGGRRRENPMGRGNNTARGPRRGRNGPNNRNRPQMNENQLDAQLDKYFSKDPEVMNQRLDDDLAMYMQQRDTMAQPIDSVTDQSMNNM